MEAVAASTPQLTVLPPAGLQQRPRLQAAPTTNHSDLQLRRTHHKQLQGRQVDIGKANGQDCMKRCICRTEGQPQQQWKAIVQSHQVHCCKRGP